MDSANSPPPPSPAALSAIGRTRQRLAGLHGWRADLAAAVLGALGALALPPLHVIPTLLVALPGLAVLLDAAPCPAVAARRGWWFGFGLHLVGLYWVTEAILVEAARFWWLVPLAVPALAATLALFIAAAAWIARFAAPGWPRALALCGAWVLGDLARQFVATGFPWNLLGSVWEVPGVVGDTLIQPAAWISVHGMTLATLWLGLAPLRGWRGRAVAGVLFLAWVMAGVVRLHGAAVPDQPLRVILVQGNVAQGQKWDRDLALQIFARYLQLTQDAAHAAGPGQVVVVWPESASPFLLAQDAAARQAIGAATGGAPALIGAVRFDRSNRPRNSLFALVDDGQIAGIYDKWHLVPFGEYQPDWFPLPIQVVPGGGFARGPGPRTLHIRGMPPVGALICYEAIFPGQVADPTDRATWLVNITNDAWFGNSSGPRQHLAAARLRAVETGLPLMRAANTGISAAFDAYGHELGRIGMNRAGSLTVPVPGELPPTLFARIGLVLPGMLSTVVLVAGLSTGRRRVRNGSGSDRLAKN